MHTDIPLKRLTALCGADLLPLLGLPFADLVSVETLELPASQVRLDTVLRVRSPAGQIYLHVLEWQGYPDRAILWRLAYDSVWMGRANPTLPVVGTVISLTQDADMGDTLRQVIDGAVVHAWQRHAVRVWELDAVDAVASGKPGLAVLSPLMAHADAALVEQTVSLVLRTLPYPQQNELLTMLGILAERLVSEERFVQRVGKERLMESKLLDYLLREKTEELKAAFEELKAESAAREAEFAAREAESAARQAATEAHLQVEREARQRAEREAQLQSVVTQQQQALQETLVLRFPNLPPTLLLAVQRVTNPTVLSQLSVAAVRVADSTAFERALQQALTPAPDHEARGDG